MNVLVTVGSMQGRSFLRLFKIVDALCKSKVLEGDKVIAQTGWDNYQSDYYRCFDLIGDEQFKDIMYNSDLVISHAGTGTVTSALKAGKKVILFPRLSKYNEHYDDHQLELCEIFSSNGYVLCAKNAVELEKCIAEIDRFVPRPFQSNKIHFNKCIMKALRYWEKNEI